MTRDSINRAIRTFVITTIALFVPGLLGWLNELTQWANDQGERPFPDGHGLVYLGVSACVAGVVAVVNGIWNAVEDGTGKGFLRVPPKRSARSSMAGAITLVGALIVLGILLIAADIIFFQVFWGSGAGVLCIIGAILVAVFGKDRQL